MAAPEAQMPFIKNLASSDRRLRNQALESITAFLSSRKALSASEARKLWQGLYYALYMSDQVLAQQAVATSLGQLVTGLPRAAVRPWLAGFWAVMARRWTEIDAHRMNKFLLLVRRVLGGALARAWEAEVQAEADALVGTLVGGDPEGKGEEDGDRASGTAQPGPLSAGIDMGAMPVGLRMHVLDIWVDECDKAGLLDREGDAERRAWSAGRIEELVEAVAAAAGMAKSVKARARESLEDERLWWRREKASQEGEEEDDEGWDGFAD